MLGTVICIEETYNLDSWVYFESVTVTQTFDNLLHTITTVLQTLDAMNTMSTVSLTGNYWIILSGVSEFSLVNCEFSMKQSSFTTSLLESNYSWMSSERMQLAF